MAELARFVWTFLLAVPPVAGAACGTEGMGSTDAGRGGGDPVAAGTHERHLVVSGVARRYLAFVPDGYRGGAAVLVLHGGSGSAERIRSNSHMDEVAVPVPADAGPRRQSLPVGRFRPPPVMSPAPAGACAGDRLTA